jgi:hypothetical protein
MADQNGFRTVSSPLKKMKSVHKHASRGPAAFFGLLTFEFDGQPLTTLRQPRVYIFGFPSLNSPIQRFRGVLAVSLGGHADPWRAVKVRRRTSPPEVE